MKKSEFKEYLKTEILQMSEATKEEVDTQKELNAELEKTKELTSTMEGKMKKSEFKDLTIPSARYFDLKANFSDRNSHFPNTIPTKEQFELECRKLGINTSSEIVIFDNLGIYSSPRVWWMFKVMGHDKVSVLNGGLNEWIKKKKNWWL